MMAELAPWRCRYRPASAQGRPRNPSARHRAWAGQPHPGDFVAEFDPVRKDGWIAERGGVVCVNNDFRGPRETPHFAGERHCILRFSAASKPVGKRPAGRVRPHAIGDGKDPTHRFAKYVASRWNRSKTNSQMTMRRSGRLYSSLPAISALSFLAASSALRQCGAMASARS